MKLKFVKFKFAMKLEFQKLEFFEKIYSEKFWKFFMVLEFHELEYYEKLDFAKLEYSNSGKFLYIFKTVVDCNIVYKKMLFGYFCLKVITNITLSYITNKLPPQKLWNILKFCSSRVIISSYAIDTTFFITIKRVTNFAARYKSLPFTTLSCDVILIPLVYVS